MIAYIIIPRILPSDEHVFITGILCPVKNCTILIGLLDMMLRLLLLLFDEYYYNKVSTKESNSPLIIQELVSG